MNVGLSTVFERSIVDRSQLPDRVIDVALRLETRGLVLDSGLSAPLFQELARRLIMRRDVLPVWALECPCPATRAASAELCAVDRSEADAAAKAAEDTITRAAELSTEIVGVRLGEVASMRREWPAIRQAFLRAQLSPEIVAEFADSRHARAAPHVDAARRSLNRLVRTAERHGVTLAIRNPPRLLGLPSPVELAQLLNDLAGAPVAALLDVAAAHLDDAMGSRPITEVLAAWKGCALALVADACGPITGLVPGRGEIDFTSLTLGADTRVAFHPSVGLSIAEVEEGMVKLRATGS